jgi:LacI family transcriptional regulator
MEKSTLKKLSGILNLSISTVSRALKDHPDISTATRQRVKELAEAMEYEPNSYAVQLRTRRSNVLGILVPTIENFFYDSFISSVEESARKHGYSVFIMQSRDDLNTELDDLHIFRKNMVMGLFASISIATEDMHPFRKLEAMDVPVVFIDRVPEEKGFVNVCLSDNAAATMAAEAIIEKNKKNVLALFGHPHLSITKKRREAFEATFKDNAPKTKLKVLHTESIAPSKQAVIEAMSSSKPPDVIFCMGDLILIGVMQAIHELKLKVPKDVAVIGISNGFIPKMYDPVITYVETSGSKLGQVAFEQMLARLNGENVPENVFVESMLVKGNSL